jgi:hypothetical protein
MNILPSNVDSVHVPAPRLRRTSNGRGVLIAVVAVGVLVGLVQTFVGFDQATRWVVGTLNNARLPSSEPPESRNWAGYTVTGGTYTAVSATWNIPEFAPDSPSGADAIWVGIGGVHGTDLIQAGTQETVSGRGSTEYQAWVETLPQPSHPVPLPIRAGDSVSITLQQQSGDDWLVSFANNSSGKSYQQTIRYRSSRSSAEWVVEAPSARRGRILPLDTFGSVSFTQASTVKDGQTVTVAQAGGRGITMIGQRGQALARPSALDADGAGFNVLESLL